MIPANLVVYQYYITTLISFMMYDMLKCDNYIQLQYDDMI